MKRFVKQHTFVTSRCLTGTTRFWGKKNQVNESQDHPKRFPEACKIMFVRGIRIGEVVALKHEDFIANAFNIRRTETRYIDDSGKFVCDVADFPKSQAGQKQKKY
ncbi:MAG: hypothetical protein Q4D16_11520 [Eubacteriales bacterium]|nr:hypothetical protein [Eubacteriales bacterium]